MIPHSEKFWLDKLACKEYNNDIKMISKKYLKGWIHMENLKEVKEKEITSCNGGIMLVVTILGFLLSGILLAGGIYELAVTGDKMFPGGVMFIASFVLMAVFFILCFGFHILNPNEAMVFTLFGKYYGTHWL